MNVYFDNAATTKMSQVALDAMIPCLENVYAKEMLKPIFQKGKLVYALPNIHDIRKHCKEQVDTLWDEVKRFENPHNYYVDLSQKLWDIKNDLLNNKGK